MQVLSFNEHEKDITSVKEKSRSLKSSICPQVKKAQSALVVKKRYDTQENLNGAFRVNTISEKTDSQFILPMRSKRTREKSGWAKLQKASVT